MSVAIFTKDSRAVVAAKSDFIVVDLLQALSLLCGFLNSFLSGVVVGNWRLLRSLLPEIFSFAMV